MKKYLLMTAALFALGACSDDNEGPIIPTDDYLKLNTGELIFFAEGQTHTVTVDTNLSTWEIQTDYDETSAERWLRISRDDENKKFDIIASGNPLETERTATISVSGTGVTDAKIEIRQRSSTVVEGDDIKLSQYEVTFEPDEDLSLTITVTTSLDNVSVSSSSDYDWLDYYINNDGNLYVEAEMNDYFETRSAYLLVTADGTDEEVRLDINQKCYATPKYDLAGDWGFDGTIALWDSFTGMIGEVDKEGLFGMFLMQVPGDLSEEEAVEYAQEKLEALFASQRIEWNDSDKSYYVYGLPVLGSEFFDAGDPTKGLKLVTTATRLFFEVGDIYWTSQMWGAEDYVNVVKMYTGELNPTDPSNVISPEAGYLFELSIEDNGRTIRVPETLNYNDTEYTVYGIGWDYIAYDTFNGANTIANLVMTKL